MNDVGELGADAFSSDGRERKYLYTRCLNIIHEKTLMQHFLNKLLRSVKECKVVALASQSVYSLGVRSDNVRPREDLGHDTSM